MSIILHKPPAASRPEQEDMGGPMGIAETLAGAVAPALLVLPAGMQERISTSLAVGFEEYNARVAAGTQPPTPGAYPDFLLAANAVYVTVTAILYLFMRNREKGFEIKGIITVYNLTCVVAAGYCAVHICLFKYRNPGTFSCNEVLEGEDGEWMAWVFWVFYAQKFWEFCDTWFFILRKSFRQVRHRAPCEQPPQRFARSFCHRRASFAHRELIAHPLAPCRAVSGDVPPPLPPQLDHHRRR